MLFTFPTKRFWTQMKSLRQDILWECSEIIMLRTSCAAGDGRVFCCYRRSFRYALTSSQIFSGSFTCKLLLWHRFHICWEAETVIKGNSPFQGWCALIASVSFQSCSAWRFSSSAPSVCFRNKIQDPKKNHTMTKPGDCDQISALYSVHILNVSQRLCHPILGRH